ncbi:hypothetical protein AABB24_004403, partial [Solanum stoloniferum]
AQLTHHVSPTLPSSSSNLLQHSKLQLTLSIQKQSRNSSFTEVEKFPKSKMMKKICASIKSFEKVILLDIVERVVCGSFKDLINLRPSSKLFNTLGSEKSVYEKVSFADFPLFSWSVRTRDQIDKRVCFVNRCMKAGNREALYKIGTTIFFFFSLLFSIFYSQI